MRCSLENYIVATQLGLTEIWGYEVKLLSSQYSNNERPVFTISSRGRLVENKLKAEHRYRTISWPTEMWLIYMDLLYQKDITKIIFLDQINRRNVFWLSSEWVKWMD